MQEIHQSATDLVSRIIAHDEIIGNPLETSDNTCIIPVAKFNYTEITLYTVEVDNEDAKVIKKEKETNKDKILEIIKKSFS